MKDLSIVIATYNDSAGAIFTAYQCLLSADDLDAEVLIVDNGSDEENLKNLSYGAQFDSRITVYKTDLKGAAPSQSIGAKLAKGKYVIFPNSHEFYDPHFFPKMINYMEKDKTIGIATSSYTAFGIGDYRGDRWGGGDMNMENPFGRNEDKVVNYNSKSRQIAGSEMPPSFMRRDWFLKVTGGYFEEVFSQVGGAIGSERWLSFGTYLFGKKVMLYPKVSCYHIHYRYSQANFPGRTIDYATSNIYAAYVLTGQRYFSQLQRDWGANQSLLDKAKKVGKNARQYIKKNQKKSWDYFLKLW